MTTYEMKTSLLPGLPKEPYRKGVGAYEGVVAHSTATPEATDEAEYKYFVKNWEKRKAFAHIFVDWDSHTLMADLNYKAWGAGKGNPRYVHVELCETKDRKKFESSYKRYVWVLAWVLHKKRLGVEFGKTFVTHDWVSRNLGGTDHTDPVNYLKGWGISIEKLTADVKVAYMYMDKPAVKPPAKPAAVTGTTHTVKEGEVLGKIAKKYGVTVEAIVKLNKIKDSSLIFAGQKLKIPELIHTVKTGDTLGKIAAANGTTVAQLVKINGLADEDKIYGGQRLKLR